MWKPSGLATSLEEARGKVLPPFDKSIPQKRFLLLCLKWVLRGNDSCRSATCEARESFTKSENLVLPEPASFSQIANNCS